MRLEFDLNLRADDRQQDFFDYLNSALRAIARGFSGTSGRRADGRYESSISGVFILNATPISLTFRLIWASGDGAIESLVVEPNSEPPSGFDWRLEATDFVRRVQGTALADRRTTFFCRRIAFFVGPTLDGEYWLPGFRLAPLPSNDSDPYVINAERAVAIDMEISAIDHAHANKLAEESSRRHVARLSLLLNKGLYPPNHTRVWVLPDADGTSALSSVRCQRHFHTPQLYGPRMPEKGIECNPGKWDGQLEADFGFAGTLTSLPKEARRILRLARSTKPEVQAAFDAGARLYQVAATIGSRFPSASLAYRVAAIDAIRQAATTFRSPVEFIRAFSGVSEESDVLATYLWSDVRSAHFHGGAFPLGDFGGSAPWDPLMHAIEVEQDSMHRSLFALTRTVIVRWMLAELDSVEDVSSGE